MGNTENEIEGLKKEVAILKGEIVGIKEAHNYLAELVMTLQKKVLGLKLIPKRKLIL